ncbi:MAG: helicase-associated domain-containing protein [Candidatus Hydrogenedentes bacterium]|nr:helicase-associated domain-containing protein [Candidatus Hydrogenedentota bacterium]
MRHGVSLLASLEGMSRPAYRIARELTNNSRSGLTVRFLSKKLEMAQEEIEYLLDVHHRLMFTDLTKIKLVPEGANALRRIAEGLENHGDVPSLFMSVKNLSPHDFRRLEEQIGLEQPTTKKQLAEEILERYYRNPDSVVTYVATREFTDTAREIFDVLWQSKDGVMPVSQIRAAHGGPEFDVEQALYELFRGFAAFEMFRFDSEERLVRAAGLLSELRQFREHHKQHGGPPPKLKPAKEAVTPFPPMDLQFSETLSRIIATLAAKPARLRGDGELFREDHRRLLEIVPDEEEPSLTTYLWVAEGVGWIHQVDNLLKVGDLEGLIQHNRVDRHRIVYDWLLSQGDEAHSRAMVLDTLDGIRLNTWYDTLEFVHYARNASEEGDQPVLKPAGAHWEYVGAGRAHQGESRLARSLEETFNWLGLVNRGETSTGSVFQLTELGAVLLDQQDSTLLHERYPHKSGEFIVQPNFDIVVPTEDMDPLLTVPLDQFAVRVSVGQATVYNLSKESFTQAIQDGHDANAFVCFLMDHNRGGDLPANVRATLDDWRGGIKRVRLRTVHMIESEDLLVMADLLHRKKFAKFLKALDPQKMVRFRGIEKAELVKALEREGFIVE